MRIKDSKCELTEQQKAEIDRRLALVEKGEEKYLTLDEFRKAMEVFKKKLYGDKKKYGDK